MSSNDERVLVTGASGYIATHIVKLLMEKGYQVRGTVRSVKNEQKVAPLRKLVANPKHELELVEADLTSEKGWAEAVKDCDYVLHTASPVPTKIPRDENETIRPAVDGVLNVLRACTLQSSKVKRVVLCSSIAAVIGENYESRVYTEKDFGDPSVSQGYVKSKILSEQAAWDFVKERKARGLKCFELSVVNPGLVVGPVLHDTFCSSMEVVKRLLLKEMPMLANVVLSGCHVTDVAEAHLAAMLLPEAVDHRHIIVSTLQSDSLKDYATYLDQEFGSKGYTVPKKVAPDFLIKFYGWFDREVGFIAPMLGKKPQFDNSRMVNVLKIKPRSTKDGIIEMAYSMIEKGFIKKKY